MSINRYIATGNLTREPELRRTANGMAVMNIGIAVNDRRKNPQTGE
jgi:single-strand DNA-binding protein